MGPNKLFTSDSERMGEEERANSRRGTKYTYEGGKEKGMGGKDEEIVCAVCECGWVRSFLPTRHISSCVCCNPLPSSIAPFCVCTCVLLAKSFPRL